MIAHELILQGHQLGLGATLVAQGLLPPQWQTCSYESHRPCNLGFPEVRGYTLTQRLARPEASPLPSQFLLWPFGVLLAQEALCSAGSVDSWELGNCRPLSGVRGQGVDQAASPQVKTPHYHCPTTGHNQAKGVIFKSLKQLTKCTVARRHCPEILAGTWLWDAAL